MFGDHPLQQDLNIMLGGAALWALIEYPQRCCCPVQMISSVLCNQGTLECLMLSVRSCYGHFRTSITSSQCLVCIVVLVVCFAMQTPGLVHIAESL